MFRAVSVVPGIEGPQTRCHSFHPNALVDRGRQIGSKVDRMYVCPAERGRRDPAMPFIRWIVTAELHVAQQVFGEGGMLTSACLC